MLLQVKGIPFLVFDAGGVLEMFDSKEFSDNVVFEPTLAALRRKLSSVVSIILCSEAIRIARATCLECCLLALSTCRRYALRHNLRVLPKAYLYCVDDKFCHCLSEEGTDKRC